MLVDVAGSTRVWTRIAAARRLSIALAAAIPLLGRLLLLPVQPIPVPSVHDEFSYLLAADTFAKGRLTNPTPPMWEHFEMFHVLMQPTYMSVYPPGQGFMLAVGKVLFGHEWWTVWLSIGLMCAALTWMLQAWLPPHWALLGGVLCGLQFGFEHYWMNAYWGGSIAATGGCLALGGFGRLRKRLRIRDSLALGAGLGMMACSRPFEGLVLSSVLAAAMALWLWPLRRNALFMREFSRKTVIPAGVLLIPVLLLMAVQVKAETGSPFRVPHEFYRRQVAFWPTFVFERPRTDATYRHEVVRKFFEEWEPNFEDGKDWGTLRGLIPGIKERFRMVGACYIPHAAYLPAALVSLIAVFFRKTRLLGTAVIAAFSASALVNWLVPHYFAPVLGAMMAIHIQFLRYVRAWKWRGRPLGRKLFAVILGIALSLIALRFAQRVGNNGPPWALARAQFLRQLQAAPGEHLVFVRYREKHVLTDEWVANGADIPGAKVIWARSMTTELDRQLQDYFRGRTFWTVDADANPPVLSPMGPGR